MRRNLTKDFGIMLNLEQGRAQGEPRSVRNLKRAFWTDGLANLKNSELANAMERIAAKARRSS